MHLITRELLYLCLDNGGDPNLPTTDAARTVFHLALVAPVPDYQLIQVNFNWGLEKFYIVCLFKQELSLQVKWLLLQF